MLERVRSFLTKETVLVVAVIAALISCAFVPFDECYARYIDWHTIALLFCLMAVVSGLRFLGVMRLLGQLIVSKASSKRSVCLFLVALAFFSSMLVTNDVALITFVPLALVALSEAGMEKEGASVVVLMTVAANLGSMLLPIGNPQNLFLYQVSGMGFGEFVSLMAPLVAASGVLLLLASFAVAPCKAPVSLNVAEQADGTIGAAGKSTAKLIVYLVLFLLCLCSVLGYLDAFILVPLVAAVLAIADFRALAKVDIGLLLTFAALFVFVGNLGRIPFVFGALSAVCDASPFAAAVCSSQAISNVPAAVLLSGFTDNCQALIVGTNVGGLGTLIASMASLISFKVATGTRFVEKGRYMVVFTAWNIAFLTVLCAVAVLMGLA